MLSLQIVRCFPFSHRLVASQIWVHVHVKEDDDDDVNDDEVHKHHKDPIIVFLSEESIVQTAVPLRLH